MISRPEDSILPVTLWSRKDANGKYEYNHLEDGHCEIAATHPAPKTDTHRSAWSKGQWVYEHAWLDGNSPPKVLHVDIEQVRSKLSQEP